MGAGMGVAPRACKVQNLIKSGVCCIGRFGHTKCRERLFFGLSIPTHLICSVRASWTLDASHELVSGSPPTRLTLTAAGRHLHFTTSCVKINQMA